jgi:hypothetical protein
LQARHGVVNIMPNQMTARAVLSSAVKIVATALSDVGFWRKGLRLVRAGDEVVSLIEIQPSRDSTAHMLTFVLNYGVTVPGCFLGKDIESPTLMECQWGDRVNGRDGTEAWWPVRESDSIEGVAANMLRTIEADVFPKMEPVQKESDLIALWKAGPSNILVEALKLQFLAQLLHRAGRRAEVAEVRAELERTAVDSFSMRALERVRALEGREK